jgi:hypothetical protein
MPAHPNLADDRHPGTPAGATATRHRTRRLCRKQPEGNAARSAAIQPRTHPAPALTAATLALAIITITNYGQSRINGPWLSFATAVASASVTR